MHSLSAGLTGRRKGACERRRVEKRPRLRSPNGWRRDDSGGVHAGNRHPSVWWTLQEDSFQPCGESNQHRTFPAGSMRYLFAVARLVRVVRTAGARIFGLVRSSYSHGCSGSRDYTGGTGRLASSVFSRNGRLPVGSSFVGPVRWIVNNRPFEAFARSREHRRCA